MQWTHCELKEILYFFASSKVNLNPIFYLWEEKKLFGTGVKWKTLGHFKRGETKKCHETSTLNTSKIPKICVWICRVVGNALDFALHGNEHFLFFSYKNWIVKSHFGWNVTLLLWKTKVGSKIMSCEPSLSLTSPRNGRKSFCPILFIIFFFHWIPGKYLEGSFLSLFFPDSWVGGLVLIFPNPEWLLQFPSLGTLYFNIN